MFSNALTFAQRQTRYVAQGLGIFLHFNMATFENLEDGDPAASANTFDPSALSIDQWLQNIVAAKAKYAVLVAKHQDGFCLWPTATTTRNVSSSSWYSSNGNIDIVSLFVSKCRQYGIAPGIYFSNYDQTFENANVGFSNALYKAYLVAQIKELLTNYGALIAIWTDATWWKFGSSAPWDTASDFVGTVHNFQPGCLLVNNSHNGDLSDTDIVEFEADTGNGTPPSNNTFPAECCQTIDAANNWFWKSTGYTPKSTATLISNLATFNARNSGYLLNCPPDTTGNIPSNVAAAMATIGAR